MPNAPASWVTRHTIGAPSVMCHQLCRSLPPYWGRTGEFGLRLAGLDMDGPRFSALPALTWGYGRLCPPAS